MPALTHATLVQLAREKLNDGWLLFEHDRLDNAYYLTGYAIELALKSIAAKTFLLHTLPDRNYVNRLHTHDLERLRQETGLESSFQDQVGYDPAFEGRWDVVREWSESARYRTTGRETVEQFMTAVGKDHDDGVFAWLSSHF